MTFFVYMLRCADGHYHVGHTDNLEQRLSQHQSGLAAGYTATRLPVELVWSQDFAARDEAFGAEQQIKGWSRAKKEALVRGDWAAIQQLARKQPDLADGHQITACENAAKAGGRSLPPVIVLVRPQLGENIGKAARAMLNFGLTEMRLVAPRDGWPNPAAGPAASGADQVLADAQLFDTVSEAVADCAHVYATTVRRRGIVKPVVTPDEAAAAIVTDVGRSAILFGPERSGLDTDDVGLARTILTVPINPEFGSLNLAQAVILVAYEWSRHQTLAAPTRKDILPPAPQAELDGLYDAFETALAAKNYFWPEDRAEATRHALRALLTRPGWNSPEVRSMRGILRTLTTERRRRTPGDSGVN